MQARLEAPFYGGAAITPSDSVNLTTPIRGLYVAVAGNVSVLGLDDVTVVWPALAAGIPHPIRAKRVNSTGTTATGIVGGY